MFLPSYLLSLHDSAQSACRPGRLFCRLIMHCSLVLLCLMKFIYVYLLVWTQFSSRLAPPFLPPPNWVEATRGRDGPALMDSVLVFLG